jgi:hypothetical protein
MALGGFLPWVVPSVAGLAFVAFAIASATGVVTTAIALASGVLAALVLLLWVGERPLFAASAPAQARALGAALGVAWIVACYLPFHARLFRGTPLVEAVQIDARGTNLPLTIPAAGYSNIDLELEGKLPAPVGGGTAPPVHYRLTLTQGDGVARVIEGRFEDSLATRRLGRRGTAVVHQAHTADVRTVANPAAQDLTATALALEPPTAQGITISAFAHRLPGPIVLALAGFVLFAAVIAFDRLGPVPETDGALTLTTAAVVGTAIILWTSNAIHPDFQTLIGSAIFGGPLGFAAGALVWWIAKRLIARPAR